MKTVSLLIGLLALGQVVAAPDTGRAALEAAMERWTAAVNARDAKTLAATMTPDVELLDADGPAVKGRDAAATAMRHLAAGERLVVTNHEITIAKDVAWRVAGIAQRAKNGVSQARGQVLEIWKRDGGRWRLHRQMTARPATPAISLERPSLAEPVLDRPAN